MRVLPFLSLITCAACVACSQQPGGNAGAAATGNGVAPSESAKSPAAREAQALARQYMTLVNAGKYGEARAMWGHGGADVGGSAADFASSFDSFSSYVGEIGDPTDITTTGDEQFVAVAAKANVTLRKSGDKRILVGLIRFRRPTKAVGKDPNSAKWTIWAVDLRRPH